MYFSLFSGTAHYRRHQLSPWFYHFQFVALFVAYGNSAVNPIIYAGFNDNFKKGKLSIGIFSFHICLKFREPYFLSYSSVFFQLQIFSCFLLHQDAMPWHWISELRCQWVDLVICQSKLVSRSIGETNPYKQVYLTVYLALTENHSL